MFGYFDRLIPQGTAGVSNTPGLVQASSPEPTARASIQLPTLLIANSKDNSSIRCLKCTKISALDWRRELRGYCDPITAFAGSI